MLVECSLVSCPADAEAVVEQRLHQRAESTAQAALQIRDADLDALLAHLAQHPRVRGWVAAQVRRGVQAELARTAPAPAAPPPPTAPSERRLSELFPSPGV